MIAKLSSLSRLLPTLLVAAAFLPGQQRGEAGGDVPDEKLAPDSRRAKMKEGADSGEEWESLTPEERLARRVTNGASAYCRFVAACKPAKLLPGQTGTLLVTALLQGSAVIPSPAPVELLPRKGVAPITVGQLRVRPAEPGRLAQAYQGRPVYDNYAVFEVPVTMTSEAKVGEKHTVSLDLKFDLYDGNSAQPVGRFVDRVATEIEVGVVPDPIVKGAPAGPSHDEEPAAAATSSGDAEVVEPVAAEPDGKLIGAAESVPAPAPADAGSGDEVGEPAPAGAAGPPTSGADDGLPMPLLLGGGAILVVILLLLVRRKS